MTAITTFHGPYTQADGVITINYGPQASDFKSVISVSVVDDMNMSVIPSGGTLSGEVFKVGTDITENFQEALDLPSGDRSWTPVYSYVKSVILTPVGFDADKFYTVSVTSE